MPRTQHTGVHDGRPGITAQLRGWRRDLAGAWLFYTRLPALPGLKPSFQRIARFAPPIGLVLGGIAALLWALTSSLPDLSRILLLLAMDIALTGGLHLDGVMDTADGLSAGPRKLDAMADSRAGALGVITLVTLLLLRAAALLWIAARWSPLVPPCLLAAGFWGRWAALLATDTLVPLRPGGGGASHRRYWQGLWWESLPSLLALTLGAALWGLTGWSGSVLLASLLAGLPGAWLTSRCIGHALGGQTGDSLGATVEWTQVCVLWLLGLLAQLSGGLA